MRILLSQTIPFCHVNGLSNTGKTLHQTLVFDEVFASNTSVSSTLIKQSPIPTTALDWFIAFHLRNHSKNSFCVFDQRYQSTRTRFWNSTNITFISYMELKHFIYGIETIHIWNIIFMCEIANEIFMRDDISVF